MHQALDKLQTIPNSLLIDGNRFVKYKNIKHHFIIKGDGKYISIAASSVLAKTYRVEFRMKVDKKFPQYKWSSNKGYPTILHRNAVREFSLTPYYRKTFACLPKQLEIDLK